MELVILKVNPNDLTYMLSFHDHKTVLHILRRFYKQFKVMKLYDELSLTYN